MKTTTTPVGSQATATSYPQPSAVTLKASHDLICNAIGEGSAIQLEYQGNVRQIIPLVYGMLRNGREAVLCYKINSIHNGEPDLVIRLYHLEKIRNVKPQGFRYPCNRRIDYYLTKHFTTVYQKC